VAGTIEGFHALFNTWMPDEARELQTIRPASHTTALGGLFIAEVRDGVQAGIYEVDSGLTMCSRLGAK
jgi:hypothetical protein